MEEEEEMWRLNFDHVELQVPVKHPRGSVLEGIGNTLLKLRRERGAGQTWDS